MAPPLAGALPSAAWAAPEPGTPELQYDPVTGQVQFPPPDWPTGFFRLEIGRR